MSNQYSLREKFLALHKGASFLTEASSAWNEPEDLLNEAVYGAVYKAPLLIHRNDIKFLEQFPNQYWSAALSERYKKLFFKLQELHEKRKKQLIKLYNTYLPLEQQAIDNDELQAGLTDSAKAHMAKFHAWDKAKATVAKDIPPGSLPDTGKDLYELSLGGGKKLTKPAYSYFTGRDGLIAILEGTPGVNNGYDLFNPRVSEDGSMVTDGFEFPSKNRIEDMLVNYYNYLANGLVDPQTPEEKKFYNPASRENLRPVRGGVGYIKDTFSKNFMIDDYARQFENMDKRKISSAIKRKEAHERALELFVKNVDLNRLRYANGNLMYGASMVSKSRAEGDAGRSVDLESDKATQTITINGEQVQIPYSALLLPHKKVVQDGKEVEVPVMLPGMPFKPVKTDQDRQENSHLLVGRKFYNIRASRTGDEEHAQIFRKLTDQEMIQSKEGKDIKHAGGLKPMQNSVGVDYMSKLDPAHRQILQDILRNPDFNFHAFVDEAIGNWIGEQQCMDNKDTCVEKMFMGLYKDDLKSLAEIRILKNLGNPFLYRDGKINLEVLKTIIEREMNRLVTQDLMRGTRRKRQDQINSIRQRNACRKLISGECGLNYDVTTVLEDYLDSITKMKRLSPVKHNLKAIRTNMTADLNALFAVVDRIRLLYEDLLGDAAQAKARTETWLSTVNLMNREDFIQACNQEIASVVEQIKKKVKGPRRQAIFGKYADLLQTNKTNGLRAFIQQHRAAKEAELAAPVQVQTVAPVVAPNLVDAGVQQYKQAMQTDPNADDKDIVNRIAASLGSPQLAKDFRAAIQPLRRVKTKEAREAEAQMEAIVKEANAKELAYHELRAFFNTGDPRAKLALLNLEQKKELQKAILKIASTAQKEGLGRESIRRIKGNEFIIRQSMRKK